MAEVHESMDSRHVQTILITLTGYPETNSEFETPIAVIITVTTAATIITSSHLIASRPVITKCGFQSVIL